MKERKSLLVFLCLSILLVLSVPSLAGGGTLTPQPVALIEEGVEVEGFSIGPLIFGQKDETTRYAHTVALNPDTCEIVNIMGFAGYQVVSFDPSVLQVKGSPETGEIVLRRGTKPGVALFYFVFDKSKGPKKEGKLPSAWYGEQITVVSPDEQKIFEKLDTVVYPEQTFVRNDNQVQLKILHFAGQNTISVATMFLDITTPEGRKVGMLFRFGFGENLTLEPNKATNFTHFVPGGVGGQNPPGRYKYMATLTDFSGKAVAFNRFEVVLGQYSFPGKPGSASLDFAGLNTDYDNKPAVISLYGLLPDRVEEKDVRILLNGGLVSQYRMRSFVDYYSTFNINLDVKGIEFPAAEYEVIAFFLSTGHVLKTNLSVPVNPEDIVRSRFNGGGKGLAVEISSSLLAEEISAKVGQMFSRLGIRKRY